MAKSDVKIKRKRSDGVRPPASSKSKKTADAARGSDPITLRKIRGTKPGPLPSFIEPQRASPTATPPTGEAWLHEIKFDGYRLLARIDGGRVRLKTRSGLDWTGKFPSVQRALERLPVVAAFLDGEVVVETERGTPDFGALQQDLSEGRSDRFSFYLFDLLHLDGIDLTRASLIDRKAVLAQLLAGHVDGVLKLSEHFTERGDIVLKHACRLSLEGIVSKLASAPYRSGRTKAWLKSKCIDSDEFVVIGYRALDHAAANRRLARPRLRSRKGKLVYAGRVGSGFSTADGRRPLAPARGDPDRCAGSCRAAATGDAPQRPLGQAVAGGRGRDARLDRRRHPAPCRFQGSAPRPAGGRCRPGEARGEDRERSSALPVQLTHPDRVLWPDVGVTKQGLAEFYVEIWPAVAPHLVDRPLSLVRCPGGVEEGCFFQKHAWAGIGEHVARSRDPDGGEGILTINTLEGLLSLVQASVLEIHVWGARLADIEKPDGITFDLDPDPEVAWSDVVDAAFEVRDRLRDLGLASFVKTTGGKGLHVFAPLEPHADWAAVKGFSHALATAMAKDSPQRYLAKASKIGAPGPDLRRLSPQRPRCHRRRRLFGARTRRRAGLDAPRLG